MDSFAGTILVDMDDVLVRISPKFYSAIRKNWAHYSPWFMDYGMMSPEKVMDRPVFTMEGWLMKPEFLSDLDQYKAIREVIYRHFAADFFSQDVYSDLEPTKLAKDILMNDALLARDEIKKIYILTRYPAEVPEMLQSKKDFCARFFRNKKIEMLPVPLYNTKAQAVTAAGIHWDLLIDDELSNIVDFIDHSDISGKEIMIPRYGYNKMSDLLKYSIEGKGAAYSYYDPW